VKRDQAATIATRLSREEEYPRRCSSTTFERSTHRNAILVPRHSRDYAYLPPPRAPYRCRSTGNKTADETAHGSRSISVAIDRSRLRRERKAGGARDEPSPSPRTRGMLIPRRQRSAYDRSTSSRWRASRRATSSFGIVARIDPPSVTLLDASRFAYAKASLREIDAPAMTYFSSNVKAVERKINSARALASRNSSRRN